MNSLLAPNYLTVSDVGNGFGCGEGWVWGNGDGDGSNNSDGGGNGDGIAGAANGDGEGQGVYVALNLEHPIALGLITEHHVNVHISVALIALRPLVRTV